jgi:catechol 2,3-dioxygenase-like lactoylglutathione lyase family enzyme
LLDHIGLAVSDINRSKAFHKGAVRPLGLGLVMEVTAQETGADAHAGFGDTGKPFFWIGTGHRPKGGTHAACGATTPAGGRVLSAAIESGGRDDGPRDQGRTTTRVITAHSC